MKTVSKTNFHKSAQKAQLSPLAKMETPYFDVYNVKYNTFKAALECNKVACINLDGTINDTDTKTSREHFANASFQNGIDGTGGLTSLVKAFVQANGKANDYDYEKDNVLRALIHHKFDPKLNPKAYTELMNTCEKEIVFENNWNDRFFGKTMDEQGNWVGLNYLGQLYTARREQLRLRLNGCPVTDEQIHNWIMDQREGREIVGLPENYPIVWALSSDGKGVITYASIDEGLSSLYEKLGRPYISAAKPAVEAESEAETETEAEAETKEEIVETKSEEITEDKFDKLYQLMVAQSELLTALTAKVSGASATQIEIEEAQSVAEEAVSEDVITEEIVTETKTKTNPVPVRSPLDTSNEVYTNSTLRNKFKKKDTSKAK